MDTRQLSDEFAKIGAMVIEKEESLVDVRNSHATIVYLTSENAKTQNGKKICGQCEKVPDKYKWSVPADFTITVFLPNIEGFTDEQKEILIFHELKHIGIVFNADGTETYSINPHDYEDFKEIIDRFGTEWSVSHDN